MRSKQVFVPFPSSEVEVQGLSSWVMYEFKVFSVGRLENSTKPATVKVYVNGKGNSFASLYSLGFLPLLKQVSVLVHFRIDENLPFYN